MQLQIPLPAQQIILLAQQEYLALLGLMIHSQGLNKINFGVDLGGGCERCTLPLPRDDLRLSNTTGTIHDQLSAATRISAVPLPKLISLAMLSNKRHGTYLGIYKLPLLGHLI